MRGDFFHRLLKGGDVVIPFQGDGDGADFFDNLFGTDPGRRVGRFSEWVSTRWVWQFLWPAKWIWRILSLGSREKASKGSKPWFCELT